MLKWKKEKNEFREILAFDIVFISTFFGAFCHQFIFTFFISEWNLIFKNKQYDLGQGQKFPVSDEQLCTIFFVYLKADFREKPHKILKMSHQKYS